jgi:hypothetical protein
MAAKAISIGIAACKIDGTSLGSCVNASIDMNATTVPIHAEKVGTAYIVPSKFAVKGIAGVLNVTTEEIGLVKTIIESMAKALKGTTPETKSFGCTVPGTGGGISGSVLLLPQFSATVSLDGWSTFTLSPPIVTALVGNAGTAPTTTTIATVPFMDFSTNKGAYLTSASNLCASVTCGGIGVGSLDISVTSQYTSIYRSGSAWPKDHVIDSVKIIADIGFYDFTSAASTYATEASVSVIFNAYVGTNLTLNLGDKCVKYLSGLRTSNSGVNTWHIKVEGNGI